MSRPAFDSEAWDKLAPLTKKETVCAARLHTAAQSRHRTVPNNVNKKIIACKSSAPVLLHSSHPSRGSTPIASDKLPFGLTQPVNTLASFHAFHTGIIAQLTRSQEAIHRSHLDELEEYISACDNITSELEDAMERIRDLEKDYYTVVRASGELEDDCEALLEEQSHLQNLTMALDERLMHFRVLENGTRMLNLPGEQVVLREDFLGTIDALEEGKRWIKLNKDFKESSLYQIRFQQTLTRAMSLIKMFFVAKIKSLETEVLSKMEGKDLSEPALQALLYTKFSSTASSLRILLFELEKRARVDANEYGSLLAECQHSWFGARNTLVGRGVKEEVIRLETTISPNEGLIKLARNGCNYLRSVAMSEYSLYRILFTSGEDEFYKYLITLCSHLYEILRPRILYEPSISILCELCTVLTAMTAVDNQQPLENSDSDDENYGGYEQSESPTRSLFGPIKNTPPLVPSGVGSFKFSKLLEGILQDTQTRLVFRAQQVIQTDVLYYAPKPADLDYPAKLKDNSIGLAVWSDEELSHEFEGDVGFRCPSDEVMATWYPTLRRTVWVLSRLNTYVKPTIFEDFAGEAVTLCRQSLVVASNHISTRESNSRIDGQLFLIRHYLLLKEMIRSVDLVHVERGADFSNFADALLQLLKNTSVIFNPNALYELASKGLPSFAEIIADTKKELDGELKQVCESLISETASKLTQTLRDFLDQCTAHLSSGSAKDLVSQSWASKDQVANLHTAFEENLKTEIKGVVDKMWIYLSDQKTIAVLLPPLLDEIIDTYTTFYNLVRSEYDFSTWSSLSSPEKIQESLVVQ